MFLFLDVEKLQSLLKNLEVRVSTLETKKAAVSAKPEQKTAPKTEEADDDVDLFGSESEVNILFFKF